MGDSPGTGKGGVDGVVAHGERGGGRAWGPGPPNKRRRDTHNTQGNEREIKRHWLQGYGLSHVTFNVQKKGSGVQSSKGGEMEKK